MSTAIRLMPLNRVLWGLRKCMLVKGSAKVPEDVIWALTAVARRFGTTCLPEALATYALLTWHGHEVRLRIGVTLEDDRRLSAHAWVEMEREVIGGQADALRKFTVLPPI